MNKKRFVVSGRRSCPGCRVTDCVLLTLDETVVVDNCPCQTCLIKTNCSKICPTFQDFIKEIFPEYQKEYGCYARMDRIKDDVKDIKKIILVIQ